MALAGDIAYAWTDAGDPILRRVELLGRCCARRDPRARQDDCRSVYLRSARQTDRRGNPRRLCDIVAYDRDRASRSACLAGVGLARAPEGRGVFGTGHWTPGRRAGTVDAMDPEIGRAHV